MTNSVDQPKVSELDAGALKAARKAIGTISGAAYWNMCETIVAAYIAALPQPQATSVGVIGWRLSFANGSNPELHLMREAAEARQAYFGNGTITPLRSALIGIPGEEKGEPVCGYCKGTGTEADYVGPEMKCIESTCSHCNGTGIDPDQPAPPVPTSERVQALLATLHQANPTDPSRWHVRPGMHAAFSDAVAALLHEGQGS